MKRIILATLIMALMLPAVALAGTWQIDPMHSSIGFKVRHFFSKVPGSFTDYAGTIEFDPENPADAKIEVVIQTASINTNNGKRDGHLKSGDFFAVEEHPEMTFKSTKVTKTDDGYDIEGLLSIRGTEKTVVLKGDFMGFGPDGWGGTRAGFEGTVTLNRKDFGIIWNKVLDTGGTVLGDDVMVSLEIEAVLQKETAE